MLKYTQHSFYCKILITVAICAVHCLNKNCCGSIILHQTSDHFENITGTVKYAGNGEQNLSRRKRSFKIYKCHRNKCTGNTCKPESYEGPHPPDWCRYGKPHAKETKCSWTKSCFNQKCETQSSNCRHQYQDYKNGRAQPRSTFNFECFTKGNYCYVIQCKGLNKCTEKKKISKTKFENEFVKKLPNCNDMEKGGRGKRSLTMIPGERRGLQARTKRAPITVSALQGYCCDIGERWKGGVVIASVRPIIR